jgi:sugar phosphate isomerase/epimerase
MKIFGRTQPLARYPIKLCLQKIHALGFDGLELCLENPDLAPGSLILEQVGQVRDTIIDLGLLPFSVSYHKDYVYNDEEFELTRRVIQWTPMFGSNIFVFSGTTPLPGDNHSWERMVSRTRELVSVAESHGVILAQEFEPGFIVGSTSDLIQLFNEIPSENLAANLDLGHVFLCDEDPLNAIRQVGKKIVHVHIENMRAGVHDHLLPQQGDMDLAAYLAALSEAGYTGGLALDLYKYDYEVVAPETIAYLRELLAKATSNQEHINNPLE